MKRVFTLLAVAASVACLKAAPATPTVDQKVNGAKEVLVQPITLKVADLSIADTVDPPEPLLAALEKVIAPAAKKAAQEADTGSITLNSGHLATGGNTADTNVAYNPTAALLDHRRASAAVAASDGTYASRLPWVDHPGRLLGASIAQAGARMTVS